MKIKIILLIILLCFACPQLPVAAEFGIARTATPVLNTPDFTALFGGVSGRRLTTDRCGQVRELEYIALPGAVFTIKKKHHTGQTDIYQVETDEYPPSPNVRLYVDGRFLELLSVVPAPRRRILPQLEEMIATLRAAVGAPYVWGGNVPRGVPELEAWFYKDIMDDDRGRLMLSGVDCSGLLYHATGGWTPRNTSQLLMFGQSVNIAGKQSGEIAAMLQPLDLVVWNGHVVVVINQQMTIESRLECSKPGNGGVVITPLSQRIAEIMRTRHPVNTWPGSQKHQDVFVVRRWYGQS